MSKLKNIFNFLDLSPKKEVMLALSKSKALKYPQLVPDVRFEKFEKSFAVFLPSEQIILSLSLFELFQVKHSSCANSNGRYQLVSQLFLANKSVSQIRNHIKNVKANPTTPVHFIITVYYTLVMVSF